VSTEAVPVNYVQRVSFELEKRLPGLPPALLQLYTLLALEFGTTTDLVMVHNAWSVWCNAANPTHRSLIPFPHLAPDVQELDRPYMEAIHAACLAGVDG
jgi:hypothetical protein